MELWEEVRMGLEKRKVGMKKRDRGRCLYYSEREKEGMEEREIYGVCGFSGREP